MSVTSNIQMLEHVATHFLRRGRTFKAIRAEVWSRNQTIGCPAPQVEEMLDRVLIRLAPPNPVTDALVAMADAVDLPALTFPGGSACVTVMTEPAAALWVEPLPINKKMDDGRRWRVSLQFDVRELPTTPEDMTEWLGDNLRQVALEVEGRR